MHDNTANKGSSKQIYVRHYRSVFFPKTLLIFPVPVHKVLTSSTRTQFCVMAAQVPSGEYEGDEVTHRSM